MPRQLPAWLGLAFAAVFLCHFWACKLYGTGTTDPDRRARWEVAATHLLGNPHGWKRLVPLLTPEATPEFLVERLATWAPAFGLWALAMLLGDALLFLAAGRSAPRGWERLALAHGLGMGGLSLLTLGLGLAGLLMRTPFALAGGAILVTYPLLRPWRRDAAEPNGPMPERPEFRFAAAALPFAVALAAMVFGGFSLLYASLPTHDFDANAYHLLGPKEWFLEGRIVFLPHNVYTNFPFLTEMWHLLGMVALDNWAAGALVGQVLVWSFGIFGALAAALVAREHFGSAAAWWTAFIYLTTPWVFRLAGIPYVEGPLMFYTALAFLYACRSEGALLAGLLAGCAASCKYTGIVNALIPMFALGCWTAWRRMLPPPALGGGLGWGAGLVRPALAFALGAGLSFGPWLVRNVAWTGNPVYPLAYSVFGGKNWTPEKAAKFAAGHRSNSFSLADLSRYTLRPHLARDLKSGGVFGEIPVRSDWQSGLVFAFLPLALLQSNRRGAWLLLGVVAYEFLVFFYLTHRLDRFWLPLLPFAAALAGAGIAAVRGLGQTVAAVLLVGAATVQHHAYCVSDWCVGGHKPYAVYPPNDVYGWSSAAGRFVKTNLRHGSRDAQMGRTLVVGSGEVFHWGNDTLYNTVFDDCLLEEIVRAKPGEAATASGLLNDAEELRRRLTSRGIVMINVDWKWIKRYREPGNYGYTDFVTEDLIKEIETMGAIKIVHAAAEFWSCKTLPPKGSR